MPVPSVTSGSKALGSSGGVDPPSWSGTDVLTRVSTTVPASSRLKDGPPEEPFRLLSSLKILSSIALFTGPPLDPMPDES